MSNMQSIEHDVFGILSYPQQQQQVSNEDDIFGILSDNNTSSSSYNPISTSTIGSNYSNYSGSSSSSSVYYDAMSLASAFGGVNSSNSSIRSLDTLPTSDPPIMDLTEVSTESNADILLEVAGTSFMIQPEYFQYLVLLPWKRIHSTAYRLEDNHNNNNNNNCNVDAETFARILEFIVDEQVPKLKKMSPYEQDDLKKMATYLGLQGLVDHLNGKTTNKSKRSFFLFKSRSKPKKAC